MKDELKKISKTFSGIIKSVNADKRTVEVVVSTASVDRHMESILPEAYRKRLKVYKDHPVLLSGHDYHSSLTKQIGIAESIKITDEGLVAVFKYFADEGNPEADWAWNLAQKGVSAYSVGFIPYGWEDKQVTTEEMKSGKKAFRVYTDVELIEISQVLIPSNRDAVQEQKTSLESTIKHQEKYEKEGRKDVILQDWVRVTADLCTKALESKDLFIVKDGEQAPAPVVEPKPEEAKKPEAEPKVEPTPEEQAKSFLELVRKNPELKSAFKSIVLEICEEVASEGLYQETLFGKSANSQQTTQEKPELVKALSDAIGKIKL